MTKRVLFFLSLLAILLTACVKQEREVDEAVESQQKKNLKAAEINVELGLGYLRQGNMQRAKQKLLSAQAQSPNSPDVAGALAYYFERTGNEAQADNFYRRALGLSHNKGPQLNNYGAFLCRHKHYKKAEHFFMQAAADIDYLNTSGAVENAGLCALADKDYASAKQFFLKALNQDPKRQQSLVQLMRIYLKDKQYQNALNISKRYATSGELDSQVIGLAYQAAVKAGDEKQANAYKWILKTKFSNSPEYREYVENRSRHERNNPLS